MKITNLDLEPKSVMTAEGAAGAWKQVPMGAADGTPAYSVRAFTLEPQGHSPYHQHPYEHLNYIIRGSGVIVGESGERPIREGDFVLVAPNELHQYRNTSDDRPLVFLCAVPKAYE